MRLNVSATPAADPPVCREEILPVALLLALLPCETMHSAAR